MKKITFNLIAMMLLLLLSNSSSFAIFYDHPNWSSADGGYTMSVAAGDMNNDGYCDLVAGKYRYPYTTGAITSSNADDIDTTQMGGYVVIYYNGQGGLSTSPDTIWSSYSMGALCVIGKLDKYRSID